MSENTEISIQSEMDALEDFLLHEITQAEELEDQMFEEGIYVTLEALCRQLAKRGITEVVINTSTMKPITPPTDAIAY